MAHKVTNINKPNSRQINACCSVLCHTVRIFCSMRHKQAHLPFHCTCLHYDPSPKRNELTLNALSISKTSDISLRLSCVSTFRSAHLSHIGYLSKCQQWSLQDNNWRHLLSQASPCGYSSFLKSHSSLRELSLRPLALCTKNLPHEAVLYCHNSRQYNTHNVCQCSECHLLIQQRFCGKILAHTILLDTFLLLIFFLSYNPCIIPKLKIIYKKSIIYGFEAFDFAEVPLTQNRQNLLREEWNSALINPLGIDPVNRTLSNILELGCAGLSWNITLSTAPTKFRSLHLASPMLRQEADGDNGLLFLLNVRQKNAPAIRTGMGLQGHIYVVPKPSYLFNVVAALTLNQKAVQRYNAISKPPRIVNFVLTYKIRSFDTNCRKIAAMRNYLIHNCLNSNLFNQSGYEMIRLNVVGSSPTGHPTIKLTDYQIIIGYFYIYILPNPP